MMTTQKEKTEPENGKSLSAVQVIGSVLAAMFGVQSKANKERDFRYGKPLHFIIAGVGFTVLFLIVVITLVNIIVA